MSVIHPERFGTTWHTSLEQITSHLDYADSTLLRQNFTKVERDPLEVAAVAALVHVRVKLVWANLPIICAPELWVTFGEQIAAAVSGDYTRLAVYRETLTGARHVSNNDGLLRLPAHAMTLGFRGKWPDTTLEEEFHNM